MRAPAPILEARTAAELAQALRARLPAFVPEWQPQPGGAGDAVLEIYARFLRTLADRIALAPDKHELAFLDLLGLDLLAAQPARAAVVFQPIPGSGDGRVPAGARLSAKGESPVVFETERAVALVQARVAEVVTLHPGRDAYADHSAEAVGGRPFTLWDGLRPVPHELYLGHDGHFALAGSAEVAIDVELRPPGSEPIELAWEWWDGESWQAFAEPRAADDGTAGLTRSGAVRLRHPCAASERRTVGGWKTHWLRARTMEPLPPSPGRRLPEVDRISMRTVLARAVDETCTTGLLPDEAFAGGEKLDLTKPAFPFGRSAPRDGAFYLACDEAFSRPGADVTICIKRGTTSEDEADAKLAPYELAVNTAKGIVDGITGAADALAQLLDDLVKMPNGPLRNNPQDPTSPFVEADISAAIQRTREALAALRDSALPAQVTELELVGIASRFHPLAIIPPANWLIGISSAIALVETARVIFDIAVAQRKLAAIDPNNQTHQMLVTEVDTLDQKLRDVQANFDLMSGNQPINVRGAAAIAILSDGAGVGPAFFMVAAHLAMWPGTTIWESPPALLGTARTRFSDLRGRITAARQQIEGSSGSAAAHKISTDLKNLSPITVAAAAGVLPPVLDNPKLAWEYWNGAWRSLTVAPQPANAQHLTADGTIAFVAPDDWEISTWNGVEARWLRARIASGSYARVRAVSWMDQQTKEVKYLAVVEPRPPLLTALRIGYEWSSQPEPPQHALALNDFRWVDHTEDAAWRGGTFAPFRPVEDETPALYVGFDAPLPADDVGVLLDVEEAEDTAAPALRWEHWDGGRWRRLQVEDETEDLTVPGVVTVRWPGGGAPAAAQVVSASGREVRLVDPRDAARFVSGDDVWLAAGPKGELAVVDEVVDAVVRTRAPLAEAYAAATLGRPRLPRFGTPRTWLRARLGSAGQPHRARVRGVHPNAVWSAQVETLEDELLGSGNGEPRQPLFFTRTPVLPGEVVEVRELAGPRARIEYPVLLEALARDGVGEDEVRVVRNGRTGEVTEVWVPWRGRPSLAFSGPRDRHYTIERTRGRLLFGDGRHGRLLPAGGDNVRARRYRSGGGVGGNVAAAGIAQVLSGAVVAGTTNPRAAEGGAETEPVAAVLERGPLTIRHRRQALTAGDFEALAREASPAVAVARAVSEPGRVTVVVLPWSSDELPQPSWQLRREVRRFLCLRAPASLGSAVRVVPPRYLPVGIEARIAAQPGADAGPLVLDATRRLRRYLHPLTGGPEGTGWPFGRDVHLSDLAGILEGTPGVDYVELLSLLVSGAPQGDVVEVAADRIVAAGSVEVTLGGGA